MASSTEPPDAALIGTILVSRYRLLRLIGAGGMGAVYEADTPTGERYAVKVLSEQPQGTEGSQTLARFIREAKVSSSLSNPHIVPTYDGGVDPGTGLPFLVMQLLYGEDLDTLVGRIGPLHPVVAARVALQAAKGLAAAHGAGFVHRDVKPSNLFLSIHGDQVTVKVCDFGLAKARATDQQLTMTGSILGSPLYMAPEQIDNPRHVDLRADVWSLGMTLYQALAGLPALHRAATFSELAVAVTTKAVPHLQDAAPWVDPGLARVVHGALIRDLSARCPDVSALHHALVPYAGGSDQLTTAMLAPVPAELRRVVAPRADYPLMWSTAGGSAGAGSDTMDVSTDPLIGKQLGGRYTLARVIGRGGMGAVYEAHTTTGERVAVKIVGVMHQSQEAMARFVREARAAMSIQSPHVVRVLDADTDLTYRVPYIAMELLEGTDLDKLLKDRGPLEPRAAAALFREACEGLAAAHALGVVHRDIKPANLFLHQRADGTITLKLCDFGVAKQLSTTTESDDAATELTRTGGIVGSPMYMSPEQARNAKSVDHRTDVWSLAMTLHQALSGRKPWEGCSTVGELIVAICTQPPTPIQDLAPWVDPRLATVVHKALRRDPADRYASVRELSQALAPFAAPGPLTRERLVALSDEQREQALSRANYPSVRPATGGTTVHGAAMDSKRTPRSTIAAVIGVSFAVLVAGGAALVVLRRPTDASPPPVASPAVGVPARVRGTVRVSPRTAIVVIGSSWREPGPAGEIELEGEPGEQITVAAAVGSSRVEVKCVLSRDGTVSPAVIEVPAAATPVVAAGGKPVASGGPQVARPTGAGGAAAVVATAVVPPTPIVTTPVATTAPTAPRPKDSW